VGTECPLSLGNDQSPYGHINQRLQIQFRAPDDERCAARNMWILFKNFGIINSITKLHLVGISTELCTLLFVKKWPEKVAVEIHGKTLT